MVREELSSSQTLGNDSQATEEPPPEMLDLSHLPPIFVSATHFETDDLHELEEELADAGAVLTYDVAEARLVLSKVLKTKRIEFDLRAKGLWTEEVKAQDVPVKQEKDNPERPTKRQRLESKEQVAEEVGKSQAQAIVIDDDDETESEAEGAARKHDETNTVPVLTKKQPRDAPRVRTPSPVAEPEEQDTVKVANVTWFVDSQKAGTLLSVDDYLTYRGRRIAKPDGASTPKPMTPVKHVKAMKATTHKTKAAPPEVKADANSHADILSRAKEDAESAPRSHDRFGKRRFAQGHTPASASHSWAAGHGNNKEYANLLHKTTTEDEQGYSSDLPEMPDWVKHGIKYACQRSTPANSPNEAFIALLKKIQLARILTNDEIGVRAYSTSIASLAAYPYKLSNPREILALPGCDAKIANLYVEYANNARIQAVEDLENDEEMKVLRLFYNIWGVGATTAREFFYDRGWRELDDIVEYGWSTLTRVQQIGVKYYDEFLDPIPRAEVEEIGAIIHRHAVKVRDDGVQSLIVGGYRRGKQACGDVDMIISHPDEDQTLNIVNDVVASLEDEGWITHTLLLSLNNSKREQQTLPFRTSSLHGGHGFDTLDKALVVWQDPNWPTRTADEARAKETGEKLRNPNIHRRVDIIISPWRTVGCAVTGWSGGTTFQRDLRRYAKNVKAWKFDSSGMRDRGNGEVVDLEGWYQYRGAIGKGRAKHMLEAERRVFEGMGLVYREPWDRCTG